MNQRVGYDGSLTVESLVRRRCFNLDLFGYNLFALQKFDTSGLLFVPGLLRIRCRPRIPFQLTYNRSRRAGSIKGIKRF